jgi:hypothetical protein
VAGGLQASERQRRGRAGRCQPGLAFHLYSTLRSDNLAEYQLPELKRCPLDELCLQVKLLQGRSAVEDVRDFLHKAVEPPVDKAVSQAVALLQVGPCFTLSSHVVLLILRCPKTMCMYMFEGFRDIFSMVIRCFCLFEPYRHFLYIWDEIVTI